MQYINEYYEVDGNNDDGSADVDDDVKPNTDEYLEVHVDQSNEGKNSSGEGGVPYEGEGVPELYCHHHHHHRHRHHRHQHHCH